MFSVDERIGKTVNNFICSIPLSVSCEPLPSSLGSTCTYLLIGPVPYSSIHQMISDNFDVFFSFFAPFKIACIYIVILFKRKKFNM